MPRRCLYIAAYDIVEPKRLLKALRILKGYASGRQKSVFECFLSPYEKRELVAAMDNLLDYEGGDRFLLLQMSTAREPQTLGRGVVVADLDWIYLH